MIYNHSTIRYIYYCGTYDEFVAEFGHPSSNLYYIHFFQYSETEPTEDGNYWHYVDGIPVIWEDN